MRLDQMLVGLGLTDSRARAQAMIRAGAVTVDGAVAAKPSQTPPPDARIALIANPIPWVSRAALKLDAALDRFGLSPAGAQVLDVGASTGGFTEVCLARGAARVYALDVGHGQLHPRIAADPRVVDLQGINARAIPQDAVPDGIDWIVSDVSFISLSKALPRPMALARSGAALVALIKPQFEAGPKRVGKGGVVRDEAVRAEARAAVRAFIAQAGWRVTGEGESPITGADGNREFLIAAEKTA